VTFSFDVKLRVKTGLAGATLEAAVRFAASAKRAEKLTPPPNGYAGSQYHAESLAGILLAASFVETAINELFLSAVDKDTNIFPDWKEADLGLLEEFWNLLEEQKAAALRKAQVALLATRRKPLAKGELAFQSADGLFKLRNAIVHYKPEWNDEQDVHATLESRLRGRFAVNPLVPQTVTWFPHLCIGAGGAVWACTTAMDFMEAFLSSLSVRSPTMTYIERSRKVLEAV
jgi:hypothetical protein